MISHLVNGHKIKEKNVGQVVANVTYQVSQNPKYYLSTYS
jgi:hypothetical protein